MRAKDVPFISTHHQSNILMRAFPSLCTSYELLRVLYRGPSTTRHNTFLLFLQSHVHFDNLAHYLCLMSLLPDFLSDGL